MQSSSYFDGWNIILETSPGNYTLKFYNLSNARASGSVTLNGGDSFPITQDRLKFCYVNVDCPALGKWGIIILSSLTLIVGLSIIITSDRSKQKSLK